MTFGNCIPSTVILPKTETVNHGNLTIALGNPSRQLLHLWRGRYGFPKSFKSGKDSFCITLDVVKWLGQHGHTVRLM